MNNSKKCNEYIRSVSSDYIVFRCTSPNCLTISITQIVLFSFDIILLFYCNIFLNSNIIFLLIWMWPEASSLSLLRSLLDIGLLTLPSDTYTLNRFHRVNIVMSCVRSLLQYSIVCHSCDMTFPSPFGLCCMYDNVYDVYSFSVKECELNLSIEWYL